MTSLPIGPAPCRPATGGPRPTWPRRRKGWVSSCRPRCARRTCCSGVAQLEQLDHGHAGDPPVLDREAGGVRGDPLHQGSRVAAERLAQLYVAAQGAVADEGLHQGRTPRSVSLIDKSDVTPRQATRHALPYCGTTRDGVNPPESGAQTAEGLKDIRTAPSDARRGEVCPRCTRTRSRCCASPARGRPSGAGQTWPTLRSGSGGCRPSRSRSSSLPCARSASAVSRCSRWAPPTSRCRPWPTCWNASSMCWRTAGSSSWSDASPSSGTTGRQRAPYSGGWGSTWASRCRKTRPVTCSVTSVTPTYPGRPVHARLPDESCAAHAPPDTAWTSTLSPATCCWSTTTRSCTPARSTRTSPSPNASANCCASG